VTGSAAVIGTKCLEDLPRTSGRQKSPPAGRLCAPRPAHMTSERVRLSTYIKELRDGHRMHPTRIDG
jgi:hypothetical protein